jgi:hypothetical protein
MDKMAISYKYDRKYDPRTVALLFGLSGNRCAHPDCDNRIIAEPTSFDDAAIVGHIAHIYSRSSDGPRPYPGTKPTPQAINGFENLLLLCRSCHALVDEQENTYTADEIIRWKASHLAKHLRTRTSFLPERYRKQTVLGVSFDAFTIDATLVSADLPIVRTASAQHPSANTSITSTEIRYWLQTDAGADIPIDMTNMQMPCPIGGRASILCVVGENGKCVLFSLLSHSTMIWLRICDPREFAALWVKSKTSPLARIAMLIVCAYLVGGLLWQLEFAWWYFVPLLLLSVPLFAYNQRRQGLMVKRLTGLQEAISVS